MTETQNLMFETDIHMRILLLLLCWFGCTAQAEQSNEIPESEMYNLGTFSVPKTGTIGRAYPGDIVYNQTEGYPSHCWITSRRGDNRYCTVSPGTYCVVIENAGKKRGWKKSYFTNVETSKAVGQKNLNGDVAIWQEKILVTSKKSGKTKFKCENFTSIDGNDLKAEKAVRVLGKVQRLEYVGRTGTVHKFLYESFAYPRVTDARNQSDTRNLEVNLDDDTRLFYKGLILEVINVENGELTYNILQPFRS